MCAIFGIHGSTDAAILTLWGLHALQHRGQESFGLAVRDKTGIAVERRLGLAGSMLTPHLLQEFPGIAAIGHTRYSTSGSKHDDPAMALTNTHPFVAHFKYDEGKYGDIALVHNGNFTNADMLRDVLYADGRIMRSRESDTEVFLHLIGKARGSSFIGRLVDALGTIRGAYSLLIMTDKKLVAVRDPFGTHPLVMGKLRGAYVFASETCALDTIHAEYLRDVEPGEIVVVENGREPYSVRFAEPTPRPCIFEWVYTMHPGSRVNGRTIYEMRKEIGRQLAREAPADADIVIAAPDSGTPYALGYAEVLGIPFELGLLRNHYAVGRSFLEPTSALRNMKVRKKLLCNPVVQGQRVVLIDDSIVRGTTSGLTVEMLLEGGAREVHQRIAFPLFIGGCPSGTDVPTRAELASYGHGSTKAALHALEEATRSASIRCISRAGLYGALGMHPGSMCDGCITREWPIEIVDEKFSLI